MPACPASFDARGSSGTVRVRPSCQSRRGGPGLWPTVISPAPFTLLVKPASADCNLRCEYCFYLGHGDFYPGTPHPCMTDEVLRHLVRSYMATPQPQYAFGWQGGEPTLMGVDFFRRVVQYQQQFGHAGAIVGNGLQTNGVLLNADFAKLFAEYKFLLGVSLDGPAEFHDRYRRNAAGRGSHADVLRGAAHLRDAGCEFNILVLVSQANVRAAETVYGDLCDRGFLYHQYIPCVEAGPNGDPLPFALRGEEWGEFLCRLFDVWHAADTRRVSVRLFDSLLALLVDGTPNICHLGRDCRQYFMVEHNGDVFPCDFFGEKRLCLGNAARDSWSAMQASPVYERFGCQKREWNSACGACEFLEVCSGDCLKHRLCANGGDPRRLSLLCPGWKLFYQHTLPHFRALADAIRREREEARREAARRQRSQADGRAPGRNDPCPCGSGRKVKQCCGGKG